MTARIAMLSMHTSPLADLGRTRHAGGMNVYVRELARELARSGSAVDIFTRRTTPEQSLITPLDPRTRVIHLPAGPAESLAPAQLYPMVGEFSCRVAHFAAHNGLSYDLIHSHYWLSALTGMALARAWDVPHVTMYHTVERLKGTPADTPRGRDAASLARIEQEGHIAASVDAITVSTEHEAAQLRRTFGLSASRLRVIPCGVDLQRFAPVPLAQRHALRQTLGLSDGQPLLLFVGRLDPTKGVDLLLESVARMRRPARLLVIGGDPPGDPEVRRLRARAARLGIAGRVSFPGAVPQARLPDYYRAADALAIASRYESFGLVAVEALACGTPVVATRVGGLPSIVRPEENGLLVGWRQPEGFAAALDRLLAEPGLRARLAARARPSVERFAWGHVGDQVRQLYDELLRERRAVAT